jgi:hypothetical protein
MLTPPRQVAWHSGAPLSASVHTCLYIHEVLDLFNGGPDAAVLDDDLLEHVLQPYLVALLKSVSLAWDELVGGNLTDVSLLPRSCSSMQLLICSTAGRRL